MDDLISRQDAIYAIEKRMDDITCEEFAEGLSEAITEISLLPSAQQWISCEKELPDVEQPVRISAHGRVFDAVYKGLSSDQEPMWVSHGCVYYAEEVSRWMPMPEQTKEKNDG